MLVDPPVTLSTSPSFLPFSLSRAPVDPDNDVCPPLLPWPQQRIDAGETVHQALEHAHDYELGTLIAVMTVIAHPRPP